MAQLLHSLVILASVIMMVSSKWTGDYLDLGESCNPSDDNCFHGSKCNPETLICDCADSDDGLWRRTFQNNDCRLLPGSTCVPRVNQDFYRCVENSECTVTRQGVDPRTCLADAPCDTGDHECICLPGKTCLTTKVCFPTETAASMNKMSNDKPPSSKPPREKEL